MGKLDDVVKLAIGAIYLVGASMLLPGFLWIIPEKVVTLHVPVHFNNVTHAPDRFIDMPDVPMFGAKYGDGVRILIIGMSFIIVGAVLDLAMIHCVAAIAMGRSGVLRVVGPICQVFGGVVILWGCDVFLPSNQGLLWDGKMDMSKHGPVNMFGMKAPDFGNLLFKIGSILYGLGAVLAIVGTLHAIKEAHRRGSSVLTLWLSIPAFGLFLCTSTLYFINGCMPASQAIMAGVLRMVGTGCLFAAVLILCVATLLEVCSSPAKGRDVGIEDGQVSLQNA